jgi:hypothetical protein
VSYLELGLGNSMFNLEAVVDRMRLDDRHRPGRVDEGRRRRRRRCFVVCTGRIIMRRISCGDAKEPWVRHRGRIRKVECVIRDIKLCHRSKQSDRPGERF